MSTDWRVVSRGTRGALPGASVPNMGKGSVSVRFWPSSLNYRNGIGIVGERGNRPYVLVDPKGQDFNRYQKVGVLTPNAKEAVEATREMKNVSPGKVGMDSRTRHLIKRTGVLVLLVTKGADEMDLYEKEKSAVQKTQIPVSQTYEVYDVTGAGDTVARAMGTAAFDGMPLTKTIVLANTRGRGRRGHGRDRSERSRGPAVRHGWRIFPLQTEGSLSFGLESAGGGGQGAAQEGRVHQWMLRPAAYGSFSSASAGEGLRRSVGSGHQRRRIGPETQGPEADPFAVAPGRSAGRPRQRRGLFAGPSGWEGLGRELRRSGRTCAPASRIFHVIPD